MILFVLVASAITHIITSSHLFAKPREALKERRIRAWMKRYPSRNNAECTAAMSRDLRYRFPDCAQCVGVWVGPIVAVIMGVAIPVNLSMAPYSQVIVGTLLTGPLVGATAYLLTVVSTLCELICFQIKHGKTRGE